jgi:hypothetical protein
MTNYCGDCYYFKNGECTNRRGEERNPSRGTRAPEGCFAEA